MSKLGGMINDTTTQIAQSEGLFCIQPLDDWLSLDDNRPPARKIFGSFWFEDELCIMFADANIGKSILAVQIANSISLQKPIGPLEADMPPSKVLYFDFELTTRQFRHRYTNGDERCRFDKKLLRAELNPVADIPTGYKDYNDYVSQYIENAIITTQSRIIIIDNLTYLRNNTERTAEAIALIKQLKALKHKYNLSILALAHTPKRHSGRPITQNDLQGSKMLINFCDSAFAIGRSLDDPDMRYLKQIKQRNIVEEYGEDSICVFQIVKKEAFLKFEFVQLDEESKQLRKPCGSRDMSWKKAKARVAELAQRGHSQRVIGARLGLSHSTINRMLKKIKKREEAEANMLAINIITEPPVQI